MTLCMKLQHDVIKLLWKFRHEIICDIQCIIFACTGSQGKSKNVPMSFNDFFGGNNQKTIQIFQIVWR
jgi:hypothetical protein